MTERAGTGDVVGVRFPGGSRVHFYRTAISDLTLREWVVVSANRGEEPGLVVVAPYQVAMAQLPERLTVISRRLSADEVARVEAQTAQVRESLAAAISQVGRPLLSVTGLRLTLRGDAAVLTYHGPAGDRICGINLMLEHTLGLPVYLEQEPESPGLFGGLGRLPAALSRETILCQRFDLPDQEPVFAPEGLVRLGSSVGTERGTGVVVSIATRDRQTRVRLESGEEVLVPLADVVEGHR